MNFDAHDPCPAAFAPVVANPSGSHPRAGYAIRPPLGWAARVLGGVVKGCLLSFAAVEGSKERDEGSPTSGAWGGSVERCLSGGGEMKAAFGARQFGVVTIRVD